MAMSCLLGQPIRVSHIRAGRENPGLRPQHLTGIQVGWTNAGMLQGAGLRNTFSLEKASDWSDFATLVGSWFPVTETKRGPGGVLS